MFSVSSFYMLKHTLYTLKKLKRSLLLWVEIPNCFPSYNARGPYPATSLGPVRKVGPTWHLFYALQKAGSAASVELCTRRISRADPYGERNPHRVGTDVLVGICRWD